MSRRFHSGLKRPNLTADRPVPVGTPTRRKSLFNPEDAFDKALADHKVGRLEEAEAAYRQILDADPKHADALYFLGRLRMGEGSLAEARDLMVRSLAQSVGHATRHNNLGTVHQSLGDLQAAVHSFRRAVEIESDLVEAHLNLGAALQALRDLKGAERSYRRVIELQPDYYPAFNNLATVLRDLGEHKAAETAAMRAVELAPNEAKAHNNLGTIRHERGDNAGAFNCFKAAIACDPNYAEAYNNLGNVFRDQNQQDAAEASFRKALQLNPNSGDAHNNLGSIYQRRGKLDEAEACFERALEIDPDYPPVLANLGTVHHRRNQQDRAMAYFRRALEIDPDFPDAHFNVSEVLLLAGEELAAGWREHEWRWRKREFVGQWRDFPSPAWDGSDLAGKTVVVWGEQGIGEEILYASMVPDLFERGARVVFECEPRLVPLCRRSFPQATVVARETPPVPETQDPSVDCHTPAGNLGRWLRPHVDDFPKRRAFLSADAGFAERLREKYRKEGDGPIVGVSWFSRNPEMGWDKTIDLADWAPLLTVPGATFVDLQYGDTSAQRRRFEEETGVHIIHDDEVDQLKDLDAFAAQVAAMDLVVSISNMTVHMAGALGVPTWVLLSAVPLWRWFSGRDDSPWYRSVRLFRQRESGSWSSVIEAVRGELEDWARQQTRGKFSKSDDKNPAVPPFQLLHDGPPEGEPSGREVKALVREVLGSYKSRNSRDALDGCSRILSIDPEDKNVLAIAAAAAMEVGEFDAGRRFAAELIRLAPQQANGHLLAAHAMLSAGETQEAEKSYGRAAVVDPSSVEAFVGLGASRIRLGRLDEALDALDRALVVQPGSVEARFNRGKALFELGRLDDAKAAFEMVLRDKPGHAKSLLVLGEIDQIQGRIDEAAKRFRQAVDQAPESAKANLAVVRTKRVERADDPDVVRMLGLISRPEASVMDRVHLSFALAKAFEDLGDVDRAFEHLDQANRLHRGTFSYDIEGVEDFAARLARVFDMDFLRHNGWRGYPGDETIFIVGMPRSGSTLVEQLLAGHSKTCALGEAGGLEAAIRGSPLGGAGDAFPESLRSTDDGTINAIAERFSQEMQAQAEGRGRAINKTPMHFLYIGFIALALPNTRIIHCRRDPRDVCYSCYRQFFSDTGPGFTYDFDELARYHGLYRRLMKHWHRVLPDRILDVDYEQVVEDLEGEARRIVAFCDLPWQESCLDFHTVEGNVKTASNLQVRQPLYGTAVGRWRPYERHLKPLFDLLGQE